MINNVQLFILNSINLLLIFLSLYFLSCTDSSSKNQKELQPQTSESINILKSDTSFIINNVSILGTDSTISKKSFRYIPVFIKDTLNLKITIHQRMDDSSTFIDIRHRTLLDTNTVNFNERIILLGKILEKAKTEFIINNLQSIYIGHFLDKSLWPITLELSQDYIETFNPTKNISISDYPTLSDFLINSKLTSIINEALSVYNFQVKCFQLEKCGLIPKETASQWSWLPTHEKLPQYLLSGLITVKVLSKDYRLYTPSIKNDTSIIPSAELRK